MQKKKTFSSINSCITELERLLFYDASLPLLVDRLGILLEQLCSLDALLLLVSDDQGRDRVTASWSNTPELLAAPLPESFLKEKAEQSEIKILCPGASPRVFLSVFSPIRCGSRGFGGILGLRKKEKGDWLSEELSVLHISALALGVAMAGREYCEEQSFQNRILHKALETGKVGLYITDLQTDAILYMNSTMKKTFGISHPEGKICWKILQKDKNGRCEFCPLEQLQKNQDAQVAYRWEEHNVKTNRIFENYDSLMPWIDGRLVHLQQSIDVTDFRKLRDEATVDELTGLLTRRAGKALLAQTLKELEESGDSPLTVVFYDADSLKHINDTYGHAVGDRALELMAQGIRNCLAGEKDFCFRLSGDEFIAVFYGKKRYEALEEACSAQRELEEAGRREGIPLPLGFSFGVFEVEPGLGLTVQEVLSKADEHMYEQKKLVHIREADRHLARYGWRGTNETDFEYDAGLLYDALIASTDSYIFVSNVRTGVFRYSRAMIEEFGLPQEIVENAAAVWGEKIHPDDKQAFLEANQIIIDGRADSHCVEYRAMNVRGEWVWVRCRGCLKRDSDGVPSIFAGFITNLGQKNKVDHITGLYNKIKFKEAIEAWDLYHQGRPLQVLLLGVDGFRDINEKFGRSFGDEVLRDIAQRIQRLVSAEDVPYRLDGDEFAVLISGDQKKSSAVYIKIAESFRYQQEYGGKKFFCTLSAGCASYPDDARNYDGLLRCSEAALKTSKLRGRNLLTFFAGNQLKERMRELELLEQLRECMERDYEGFSLVYQPQVATVTGKVTGAEALARWSSPIFGPVSPAEFIPLLEQSGLTLPFGRWVFREAMTQCREWVHIRPDFVVSVNFSYMQMLSEDMVPFIRETLSRLALPPSNVVLELTESCISRGEENLQVLLQSIRKAGIRIAMDDFGTGYSSLGRLKTAPADIVKIDRVFVRDILTSHFDVTFIHFITKLCHEVGISVCLEGVEREEELRCVKSAQLDHIQGFLFGRPVPAEQFTHDFLACS